MKIRPKNITTGPYREVVEQSERYYIAWDRNILIALPKTDYEPVPDERWEDVTGDVEIDDLTIRKAVFLNHGGRYRLVKRSLWDCLMRGGHSTDSMPDSEKHRLSHTFVLLVERKIT